MISCLMEQPPTSYNRFKSDETRAFIDEIAKVAQLVSGGFPGNDVVER